MRSMSDQLVDHKTDDAAADTIGTGLMNQHKKQIGLRWKWLKMERA